MDVTKIPFAEKVGITRNSEGGIELPFDESVHNHLQTVHAAAQYALAETESGEMLQTLFPELADKVVPVLRDSTVKYKKPAQSSVSARASVTDESVAKFREQLARKGRSSIVVRVEVVDQKGIITSVAEFSWFIQAIA